MATLHVVSTPIGNLDDLSSRARTVLCAADTILAEDTRRTGVLAGHVGASGTLVSLHAHNEAARVEQVLAWLDEGMSLALVSDAGTPLVSDPGARLVEAVIEAGHDVVPIPGPSAPLTALIGSGLAGGRFTFLGFVGRKGREREADLGTVAAARHPVVLFESPQRLGRLLEDLVGACGPERRACVARELTKVYEEFRRGTLHELAAYYEDRSVKGEVTVVIDGAVEDEDPTETAARAEALARSLLGEGMKASAVAKEVARRLDVGRNEAYRIVHDLEPSPSRAGEPSGGPANDV